MTQRSLLTGLLIGLAVSMLSPAAAVAQKLEGSYPAEKFAVAQGGVDLRSGRYAYSETDLSIGSKDGGIEFNRIMPDGIRVNPFGNFSHNWDIKLIEMRVNIEDPQVAGIDFRISLRMGGRAYTFESYSHFSGYEYKSGGPTAVLTYSGGTRDSATVVYTVKTPDGATLLFRPMGGQDCAGRCAYISELTQPDGTKYSFSYALDSAAAYRAGLIKVTSSRGHALLLEGAGTRVTKACVLNLATAMAPADGFCPTTALATAGYTYDVANTKLTSVAGADGAVSQFTYTAGGMGFIKPGYSTPWLTNSVGSLMDEEGVTQEITLSQSFADGRSFTYAYEAAPPTTARPNPSLIGGRVTDSSGKFIDYLYDFPVRPGSAWEPFCPQYPCTSEPPDDFLNWVYQTTAGPVKVVDELGRTSTADYCDPVVRDGLPQGYEHRCAVIADFTATDPEGGTSRVVHDGFGNVKKVTKYPKPGSSLAPIVTEAAYAISNIMTQTRPLWIRDANGNQTDYTYDPVHGGVLTETGPAVNGIRPQKRYAYTQRYAWLKSGVGYAQAPTAVWLLLSERFCRTSAWNGTACSVAGDEVVTSHDYGPNSGPNNLSLRGTAVTADGVIRRTCYGYDTRGRKISETTPNANLVSCP